MIVDSLASAHRRDENNAEIRAVLGDLNNLAKGERLTIVCIHHLRKRSALEGQELTLDRLRGSSAIAALARSVIAVSQPDVGNPVKKVEVLKANFCEKPPPFGMTLTDRGPEFCAAPEVSHPETARDEATEFLRGFLRDGKRPRAEVLAAATLQGYAERTIERARQRLGVVIGRGYDHERRLPVSEWGLPLQ